MQESVFRIEGMSCAHCQSAVTRALQGIDGVAAVQVSLERNEALVTYDDQRATVSDLKRAVEEEGYRLLTA